MVDHRDEGAIRARAYQLWVESGYADGYQEAHWRQAEREHADKKAQDHEARPDAGSGVPAGQGPAGGAGRHSDGLSTFPSVLDPGPDRSAA